MRDGRIPILYVAPWVDLGGSDKGTIDWFKHIDRGRWAPSLITTQPSPNRWLHHVEPYADEIWALPDLMAGSDFPAFILGFIESRGVQVVHIMNSRLAFDLMPDMTCLRHPPSIVVQMHAEEPDRSGYVRYVATRYGNLVDAFSVTSRHLREAIAGYDIPKSKVDVIYSGVDGEQEFNPERVAPFSGLPEQPPRILWPGRLVEQKDPLLTVDVLAALRTRGTDCILDVVGDGHLAPAMRKRAEERGVREAICWHPPSHEMARWYRSTHLVLMTSLFEGVPYVVYEALSMGVPVVAPALPGNVEVMGADEGVLIEPRDDVEQYADAIARLLDNDDRRLMVGKRFRERMLSCFSLREMGRRYDQLFERLTTSRPASVRRRSIDLPKTDDIGVGSIGEAPRIHLTRDPTPERSVGVIVPCYRHGIFLAECVRSIRDQSLPPADIVVVDDASDDPETIDALAELDRAPDVDVIRSPVNSGPSVARNRALAMLATNYVLPLDADDQLLPEALERMVSHLESAPPNVGFVYPNAQHIGNRADFVQSPAYNVWLLLRGNYCPAPTLFDRRIFDAQVRYPEDVVFGHEDWDLVLQLADRRIYGQHIDGATFLYRRRGFSRVKAVEYGPHAFHEAIERRHPTLYRHRNQIKARWAPALSVILLDGEGEGWRDLDLGGGLRQTCEDFELLSCARLDGNTRMVTAEAGDSAAWLQTAIARARGRWVSILTPAAAHALRKRAFVEYMLRGVCGYGDTVAVVLAEAPGIERATFSQLTDAERLSARPVGVTFERSDETKAVVVEDGLSDSLVADLVLNLQSHGPVQWRLAPRVVAVGRDDRGTGGVEEASA